MTHDKELQSNCCGAIAYAGNDICGNCGEHCAAVDADGNEFAFSNQWEPVTE